MEPDDLTNGIGGQSFEKSADGRFIRQGVQAEQRQKESIVLEFVGLVDPLHACDQQKQDHQDEIGWIEVRPIRTCAQDTLQTATKIQLVTKPLNQEQPAVVGEGIRFERKLQ